MYVCVYACIYMFVCVFSQALCYPFKISYEDFEFEETREGRQCNEAVEE